MTFFERAFMKAQRSSLLYFIYACLLWASILVIDFTFIGVNFSPSSTFGNAVVSGALLNIPYTEFYLKDYWGYGLFTSFLYQHFPQVAWHPVIFIGLMIGAMLLPSILIWERYQNLATDKKRHSILYLVLLAAIININLVTLEHNRVAFLLMASALSIPLFSTGNGKKWLYVLYTTILTLLAVLMRVEAAIGVLLVMGPVLIYQFRNSFRQLIIWLILPLMAVCMYSLSFFYALEKSPLYYYQIEPDFEYELMDKNNIVPWHAMQNATDSIRYEAIGRFWFLGDSAQIPPSFIRSLIQKQNTSIFRYLPGFEGKAFKSLTSKVVSLFLQPVSWAFCLLLALAILINDFKRVYLSIWGLYVLGLLIALVGSINQDIEPRIAEPVLTVACITLLPVLLGSRTPMHRVHNSLLLLGLGVVFCMQFVAHKRNDALRIVGSQNQVFLNKVNSLPVQYVATLSYEDLFNFAPSAFATYKMFPGKTVLPLHLAQYSHSASLKTYLQKTTGCTEHRFACLINFLIAHKNNCVIVANAETMDFLQRYMKVVYGINFSSTIVNKNWQAGKTTVYRIN